MATRHAWVLNLDADLELAAFARGVRYSPTDAVKQAMAPHAAWLRQLLCGPEDVVVDDGSPPGSAQGLEGLAFCPTARAVALLVRAGARPELHPPQEVLADVNARAFCASLGQTLPDALFARDLDGALAALARAPTVAPQWRAKRPFGMAGRGQRTMTSGRLEDADKAFLRAAIAEGGVQLEPNVAIVRELGLHGWISSEGSVHLGRIVQQTCDERGQWLETSVADDVDEAVERAIREEGRRVSEALRGRGYFGPFGIDAFLYRGPSGLDLQPRSEINARYSMGFPIGFGPSNYRGMGVEPPSS